MNNYRIENDEYGTVKVVFDTTTQNTDVQRWLVQRGIESERRFEGVSFTVDTLNDAVEMVREYNRNFQR